MLSKMHCAGSSFVITGGAMGMGKLYAHKAISGGASHVILWDVNKKALTDTVEELQARTTTNTRVYGVEVDLRDKQSIDKAVQETLTIIDVPDVLINNAGIVKDGHFWTNDLDRDVHSVIDVNLTAPMQVTLAFLPQMIAHNSSPRRIMNIASAAGTVAQPRMSVYAGSKWGITGWSDSLRVELMIEKHKHIKVTTVSPSFVTTGMFEGAKAPILCPLISPEKVVEKAWKAMITGRAHIFLPPVVYVNRILRVVLPVPLYDTIMRLFGVYRAMDNFVGRGH